MGTHWSEAFVIPVTLDTNGHILGHYCAVILAKQNEEDGNSNRDMQPKPALQKGRTTLEEIMIIEPDEDDDFVFNASTHPNGSCDIACQGTVYDAALDENLEWSLSQMAGSTLSSEPDPAEGGTVTFTYTTLPTNNSEFGDKTLKLTCPDPNITDTQEIQIFFARDAYNHPPPYTAQDRNWFYYWKAAGVVADLAGGPFHYYDTNDYFGFYEPGPDLLWVCNLAPTQGDELTVTNKNTQQTEVIGAPGEGIDCCAQVCTHELMHQWIRHNWGQLPDSDDDGVPDADELATHTPGGYYLDPYDPDTYNIAGTVDPNYATIGDQEFLCRKAEQSPGATNPSQDWSDTNGKQWGL